LLCLLGGAQVGGGDLEAVEEEAGAARVDVVGGDADEELAEGLLDGVVVGGGEEGECAAAGEALVRATGRRESWW
jgi:ABC-type sugar transport system substrate-binding protein